MLKIATCLLLCGAFACASTSAEKQSSQGTGAEAETTQSGVAAGAKKILLAEDEEFPLNPAYSAEYIGLLRTAVKKQIPESTINDYIEAQAFAQKEAQLEEMGPYESRQTKWDFAQCQRLSKCRFLSCMPEFIELHQPDMVILVSIKEDAAIYDFKLKLLNKESVQLNQVETSATLEEIPGRIPLLVSKLLSS